MVKRRGKASIGLAILFVVLWPMSGLLFRRRWRGLDNVPRSGPVILVANHVSYVDPIAFARFTWDAGRIPRFLAKESLFRIFFVGWLIRSAGQIPVRRGGINVRQSLDAALMSLDQGECVCIYPEGTVTRDPDWWPMAAKTGAARLALLSKAPVIPVAQWGPQFAYDKYHHQVDFFPPKKVHCVAGPAIDLSPYYDQEITTELLREVTDLIMRNVRDLLAEVRGQVPPKQFYRRTISGLSVADEGGEQARQDSDPGEVA